MIQCETASSWIVIPELKIIQILGKLPAAIKTLRGGCQQWCTRHEVVGDR